MTIVRSHTLVLANAHVDTDQIIPARFLTTVSQDGLGRYAFHDWRDRAPFTDPRAADAQILVAGENFGCGSSREHAAWALADYGVRVVISSEIADIFRANAVKNGILPIQVPPAAHAELLANPWAGVEVDLPARCVRTADGELTFEVDAFSAHCLVNGLDELDHLVSRIPLIERFEDDA